MNKLELHLRERFELTKRPYYGLNKTKFIVGESFDVDVKELREKEMIQPVGGINGWLIQILDWETKWNINESK